MRWLIPLLLVFALAICAVDDAAVARKRRFVVDRPSPGTDRGRGGDDRTAWQHGTFDAATGTLTWFDDVFN